MTEGVSRAPVRRRQPRWTVFPTPRLAMLVLVAAAAWLVPGDAAGIVVTLTNGVLVLAAAADFLLLPRRRDIDIERIAPETLGLGDAAELQYAFSSRWRWPVTVTVADEMPPAVTGGIATSPFVLGPRTRVVVVAPVTGAQRGCHPLGDIAVTVTTRLGLLQRIIAQRMPDEVVVVPSLAGIRAFRLLSLQHRLSDIGMRALKRRGEGGAFAGLREYTPGDDPRSIDWKATARHGRMISREETVERSQTVLLAVDCGRAMTQMAGRLPRFEHVLAASLMLTDVAANGGDRVGLIAFDDQIRAFVPPQRQGAAVRQLRIALSALDATSAEPDYAAAFRMLAARQRRRALLVLFTDVIDARAARSLASYAARAALRHALVLVALQNEALLSAARPSSTSPLALFRSAAAEELVHERDEALARIRQAGVTVLDVPPTRMAAAVVNQYLEIKSRGAL